MTEEYNTVLFSWYYKGFELFRRYFVKHHSGVNLENLDFEEVDNEMEIDEVAKVAATDENVLGEIPANPKGSPTDMTVGNVAAT